MFFEPLFDILAVDGLQGLTKELRGQGSHQEGYHQVDPSGAPIFFSGTISRSDIAPLLIPNSTNWLYLNVTDRVPGAGILFGATIQTSAVPEPTTFVLTLTGLVGVFAVGWIKCIGDGHGDIAPTCRRLRKMSS